MSERLFMGVDSSTQSMKVILIDESLNEVAEQMVNFDADLPQFKTRGGVHHGEDGLTVTSPPQLWVAALDLVLDRLKDAGAPLDRVVAISGSGQQHGSVYWKKGAREGLRDLRAGSSLHDQTQSLFSVSASPIWMDSSTGDQCQALEAALGGPQTVADITGSRAYERFTGNQIAKVAQTQSAAYADTERISLVSSLVATLFIGDYAAIDVSDGSGMNMMDIRSRDWSEAALEATAPDLADRMGEVVASHACVGTVHSYFVESYGFSPDCQVIACSGDNPCSLAGLRLQQSGDIAISMGTSDTIFGALSDPQPSADEGHIFCSPVNPEGFMALVCYKNGSLTRESVRDAVADGDWDTFSTLLSESEPGNGGRIGFYLKEPEITPPILTTGTFRFDEEGQAVEAFDAAGDVRAVVEGQFLSMRLHCRNIGIQPTQILATGGASHNAAILQVMADVFGAPVYTAESPNSAPLGAAYRALHGWACKEQGDFVPFAEVLKVAPPFQKAADPNSDAHQTYSTMLSDYERLEQVVIDTVSS